MRPTIRTLAFVLLLALGAAACSSGDAPPAPDGGAIEPQALLRDASVDLATQPVVAEFTMDMAQGGASFSVVGDMAVDPEAERARFSYSIEGLPGETGGATSMEMVVEGDVAYMRSEIFPDAGWLRIDMGDAGLGDAFGGAGGGATGDPSAFLNYLRGADDVEIVGTEEVNGAETTHFRGTLDLAAMAAELPKDERHDASAHLDELERQLGDVRTTFDAWVDGDGVPRRFVLDFSSAEDEGSFVMRIDVVQIGGEVQIDVPSGDAVTDLGELNLPMP